MDLGIESLVINHIKKLERFEYENKMKLFQLVQENFVVLGICSNQPRFNRRSMAVFLFLELTTISAVAVLFLEASTFTDYLNTFYVISVVVASIVIFATLLSKKNELFELIHNIEDFAHQGELPQLPIG